MFYYRRNEKKVVTWNALVVSIVSSINKQSQNTENSCKPCLIEIIAFKLSEQSTKRQPFAATWYKQNKIFINKLISRTASWFFVQSLHYEWEIKKGFYLQMKLKIIFHWCNEFFLTVETHCRFSTTNVHKVRQSRKRERVIEISKTYQCNTHNVNFKAKETGFFLCLFISWCCCMRNLFFLLFWWCSPFRFDSLSLHRTQCDKRMKSNTRRRFELLRTCLCIVHIIRRLVRIAKLLKTWPKRQRNESKRTKKTHEGKINVDRIEFGCSLEAWTCTSHVKSPANFGRKKGFLLLSDGIQSTNYIDTRVRVIEYSFIVRISWFLAFFSESLLF